jgi:hypothetical protein
MCYLSFQMQLKSHPLHLAYCVSQGSSENPSNRISLSLYICLTIHPAIHPLSLCICRFHFHEFVQPQTENMALTKLSIRNMYRQLFLVNIV